MSDLTDIGNLVTGAADILSGFSISNKSWQRQRDMAREQMNWQERMSNTAHQREVSDLLAAGLNPVLSANAGASTPANPVPEVPPEFQKLGLAQMQQAFANAREAKARSEEAKASAELAQRESDYWRSHPDEYAALRSSQALSAQANAQNDIATAQNNAYAAEIASKDVEYWRTHPEEFKALRKAQSVSATANAQNDIATASSNALDAAYWLNHPLEYNALKYNTVKAAENQNFANATEASMAARRDAWESEHPYMYMANQLAPTVTAAMSVAGTAANAYIGGKIAKGMQGVRASKAATKRAVRNGSAYIPMAAPPVPKAIPQNSKYKGVYIPALKVNRR